MLVISAVVGGGAFLKSDLWNVVRPHHAQAATSRKLAVRALQDSRSCRRSKPTWGVSVRKQCKCCALGTAVLQEPEVGDIAPAE
jgi:hypothetical protein